MQFSCFIAMKPSPMPLFNYRKRERQAMVSDPQKNEKTISDSGPPTASSNQHASSMPPRNTTSGIMGGTRNHMKGPDSSSPFNKNQMSSTSSNKPSGYYPSPPHSKTPGLLTHKPGVDNRRSSSTPASHSHQIDNQQSSFNPYGSTRGRGNPNSSGRGSSSSTYGRGMGRGGGNDMNYNNNSFRNIGADSMGYPSHNDKNNFNNNTKSRQNWESDNSSRFSTDGSSSSSFPPPGVSRNAWSSSASMSSNDPRGNAGRNVNNKPNVVKLQSGNVNSQMGMPRQSNSSQSRRFNQRQTASFDGDDDTSAHMFGGNSNTSFSSIFDVEDVAKEPFPKSLKVSPPDLDTSTRLFTCPIRDMQSWSEAGLYDGLILFEIYGLVLSGPTDSLVCGGKEFYMRDQSATIRCVFYEIDRELPQLMKGQVYRLVGSMDKKKQGNNTGCFKVLSIRKAETDERMACQDATEVSLHEMDRLARHLDKEQ